MSTTIRGEVRQEVRHRGVVAGQRNGPPLRRILVLLDLTVVALGWAMASIALALIAGHERWAAEDAAGAVVESVIIVGAAGVLLAGAGLYRRRICMVRRSELARLGAVVAVLAPVVVLLTLPHGPERAAIAGAMAAAVWYPGMAGVRGIVREWVHQRRAGGDFAAPVVVVAGENDAMNRLMHFIEEHPVLGYEVRGVVGPRPEVLIACDWLGEADDLVGHVERAGATGAMLDGRSMTGDQLSRAIEQLTGAGFHAHVSTGVVGFDHRRVSSSSLADETYVYVGPVGLPRRQVIAKRILDVGLAALLVVLFSPVLAVSALAIWLGDRGPVLFRQQRVGHSGEWFTMYKFRTMVVGADRQVDDFSDQNERDGPLFKLTADPRVTAVGRILRAASIDELPQLFNVLEGTMSLVGPRPAMPEEAEQFDADLQRRTLVKPGLTGLWQVEARDLSSFDLYRRYDLMYVQNWSVAMDLSLIARTVASVGLRSMVSLRQEMRKAHESRAE